jgi:hypothetical protein
VSYSAHLLEGDLSLNKQSHLSQINPYFGSAKLVPSKLPHKQSKRDASYDIPRPNTHVEEKEGEEKQEKTLD